MIRSWDGIAIAERSIVHEVFIVVKITFIGHLHVDILRHVVEGFIKVIVILCLLIVPIHILCDGIEQIR
jgi:hypothetical protein